MTKFAILMMASASVAADFRVSILTMHDGRVLTGILGASTARTVELQTATEKLTLQKSDIETTKPTNLSIMPEGQLNSLSKDDIRDLIGFLSTP